MRPTRRADLQAVLCVVLSFSAACDSDDSLPSEANAAKQDGAESAADESAGEVLESEPPESKISVNAVYEIEVPKSIVALPTTFRVTNRGSTVRSRMRSCWGDNPYRPQPEGAERQVICPFAPQCNTLADDETVPTDTCSGPSCGDPPPIHLSPGQSEEVTWDGRYREGTIRGCWQAIALTPGTRMTTKVCWGVPSAEYQVVDFRCTVASFAYGDPLVEVDLE